MPTLHSERRSVAGDAKLLTDQLTLTVDDVEASTATIGAWLFLISSCVSIEPRSTILPTERLENFSTNVSPTPFAVFTVMLNPLYLSAGIGT